MKHVFIKFREQIRQKKERVSVPSSFRSYLNSKGYNGFVVYPSFNHSALDACAQDRIEKLSESIDSLGPFEDKKRLFCNSVLSESVSLNFDGEGRVTIPEKMLKHAKIKSNIVFVGLGKIFQIWDPASFEKFKSIAKKKSYMNRSALKWDNKFKKEGV